MQAVESGSPEKVPGKNAFYYINHHNSGTSFGLTDSTACNFEASWGTKELHLLFFISNAVFGDTLEASKISRLVA